MVNRLAVLDEVGLVNYVAFFSAIGVVLKPDDSHGVSSQITDGSKQTADDHHIDQQKRYVSLSKSHPKQVRSTLKVTLKTGTFHSQSHTQNRHVPLLKSHSKQARLTLKLVL